jgi:hypothetical protein
MQKGLQHSLSKIKAINLPKVSLQQTGCHKMCCLTLIFWLLLLLLASLPGFPTATEKRLALALAARLGNCPPEFS